MTTKKGKEKYSLPPKSRKPRIYTHTTIDNNQQQSSICACTHTLHWECNGRQQCMHACDHQLRLRISANQLILIVAQRRGRPQNTTTGVCVHVMRAYTHASKERQCCVRVPQRFFPSKRAHTISTRCRRRRRCFVLRLIANNNGAASPLLSLFLSHVVWLPSHIFLRGEKRRRKHLTPFFSFFHLIVILFLSKRVILGMYRTLYQTIIPKDYFTASSLFQAHSTIVIVLSSL